MLRGNTIEFYFIYERFNFDLTDTKQKTPTKSIYYLK